MKAGKLKLETVTHETLGRLIEVEVPVNCTDLVYTDGNYNGVKTVDVDTVIVRVTFSTALDLAEALFKMHKEELNRINDSYCGAI